MGEPDPGIHYLPDACLVWMSYRAFSHNCESDADIIIDKTDKNVFSVFLVVVTECKAQTFC